MKICITAEGNNLDSQVDPRFGRCRYFIVVDTETMQYEAIDNPNINAASGAGIQSGQLIANKQVQIVLSGNIGPNAFETLQQAGIEMVSGAVGTVRDVVEKYKKGEFKPTQGPTAKAKFGR